MFATVTLTMCTVHGFNGKCLGEMLSYIYPDIKKEDTTLFYKCNNAQHKDNDGHITHLCTPHYLQYLLTIPTA